MEELPERLALLVYQGAALSGEGVAGIDYQKGRAPDVDLVYDFQLIQRAPHFFLEGEGGTVNGDFAEPPGDSCEVA